MKKIMLLALVFIPTSFLHSQDKNYAEWYLQRNDVEIFVKEIGTGKDTVLVVHGGFGANHDYMLDAISGLHDQFRFILYDQRGSLLSPAQKENLTFQKNVDDLLALTKALKLKRAKILCHSMGTLVGMEFTEQHPESVHNLVLTGAVLPKSDSLRSVFSERHDQQIEFLKNRKEVKDLMAPFKAKGVDTLRTIADIDSSPLSHKDLTEFWRIKFASVNLYHVDRHHLLKGGKAYYKGNAAVMAETVNWDYDYRKVLNDSTKTTIINGAYDFLDFNGEMSTRLLEGYDNIDLKLIPNAGHNSWIDEPQLFRDYLQEALRK